MFKYKGANRKFKLSQDNYYTQKANEHYASIHSFINYIGTPYITGCSARVIHELEEPSEPNDAMLIGSYVDSYYEGTLDEFKANTPQLFKKDGSLLATFAICNTMIERAENDKLFKTYMTGKKQMILTGNFADIDWKIKIDNAILNKAGDIIAFTDMKTCRDIHSKINGYSFIEAFGYDFQLALYQEILRQNIDKRVPAYINAISKEKVPETAVIFVEDNRLDECLEIITNHSKDFKELLERKIEPQKCGICDYCKATRVNTKVLNYLEL